jgi:hypothetical protein
VEDDDLEIGKNSPVFVRREVPSGIPFFASSYIDAPSGVPYFASSLLALASNA